MFVHAHLWMTLILLLLTSGIITYANVARDWVGLIHLGPAIIFETMPSLFIVALIYGEIFDVVSFEFLSPYRNFISLCACIGAEFLKKLLVGRTAKAASYMPVRRAIARAKYRLANELEQRPDCLSILKNAIQTYDFSNRAKGRFLAKLGSTPTRDEIFAIMAAVGTAHLKSMVPRSKHS